MADQAYPDSLKMRRAVRKLERLVKPSCRCNRCGNKQAIPRSVFSTAKGARCLECGGRMELMREEAARVKKVKNTPAIRAAGRKPPPNSSWSKLPEEYSQPSGGDKNA